MVFFCTKTGVRIAAPGVSKAVDPKDGHDEVVEIDGEVVLASKVKAPKSDAKGDAKAPKGDAKAPKSDPPKDAPPPAGEAPKADAQK